MHYALYKKEKHLNFDKFKVEFNASLRFFKHYNPSHPPVINIQPECKQPLDPASGLPVFTCWNV